ncbi:10342_t:CDS:2 [Ambispora leptoticha]|uniref:10342_t:CDS:1 n=1 Tax=Ambispora leptoticha TaxID=144679 RepID=A0A9N8VVJ4_9GLOM|nr:10342_t:CDS:2 [Ambispora leptoticha]
MFNNSHSSEENNFYAEFESPPPYDSVYFEQNNDNDSFAGRTYTPINSSNNNNNANSLNGRLPSPPSKNSHILGHPHQHRANK